MDNNLGSTLLEDQAMVNTEDGLIPMKREKRSTKPKRKKCPHGKRGRGCGKRQHRRR